MDIDPPKEPPKDGGIPVTVPIENTQPQPQPSALEQGGESATMAATATLATHTPSKLKERKRNTLAWNAAQEYQDAVYFDPDVTDSDPEYEENKRLYMGAMTQPVAQIESFIHVARAPTAADHGEGDVNADEGGGGAAGEGAERKHICPVCGKGFVQRSSVHRHLKQVHKKNP